LEEIEEFADALPQGVEGSFLGFAQMGLEL
jgi:hypothetical protein